MKTLDFGVRKISTYHQRVRHPLPVGRVGKFGVGSENYMACQSS
jgi:hypothetical protein